MSDSGAGAAPQDLRLVFLRSRLARAFAGDGKADKVVKALADET